MTSLPDVSIIIPTYNGADHLGNLLTAVRRQDYPATIKVIAIDSSSTDSTIELLEQHNALAKVIPKERFTHGYARNLGVRLAETSLVVFMSQDVEPVGQDFLRKLVHLLDDPSIGAAYVRQLARDDATPLERFFQQELYPPRSRRFRWESREPKTLNKVFFSNVCSIARRELCLAFPFDEELIMSEDQAFAMALLREGHQTLYSADVAVFHSHRYDLKTMFRRNFDSAYSLRGITDDTMVTVVKAGMTYVIREAVYLIKTRQWHWLPLMVPYEAARIFGRVLGSQADLLPLRTRVASSLHPTYWTRTRCQGS